MKERNLNLKNVYIHTQIDKEMYNHGVERERERLFVCVYVCVKKGVML